jgi:hypothetical protein
MDAEIVAVTRDDAGGFLAAMLKRVETEVGKVGGFGMAEDAEDTTFVVEMIVGFELEKFAHANLCSLVLLMGFRGWWSNAIFNAGIRTPKPRAGVNPRNTINLAAMRSPMRLTNAASMYPQGGKRITVTAVKRNNTQAPTFIDLDGGKPVKTFTGANQ